MKLDEGGWSDISISELAEMLSTNENDKFNWVTVKDIEEVVNTDPKGRYEISEEEPKLMRATYGHSIQTIDLLKTPSDPEELPTIAFFGCSQSDISSILQSGINTSERQYIHLSVRKNDALAIARKKYSRGPRIVSINLEALAKSGIPCKSITSYVIIIESVPSQFISEIPVPEIYSQKSYRKPYGKSNFRSSGHPSTFQSRGNSRNNNYQQNESNHPSSRQNRLTDTKNPPKKDSSNDFDNEIEFVFTKKNKNNPMDESEITDDDFDFEMD